jgi:dTDP-4-dehydrorhamnose 3,5-epimerase
MQIEKTKFKDLIILRSEIFKDNRGFFKEINKKKILKKNLIFDCLSHSIKNTIRGLHFQAKKPQGKFITVVQGEILDVAVDLRKNSKTYGQHFSIKIKQDSNFSIFIPENFAHGFACLSKTCTLYYRCTNYRHKQSETTLKWNDPDLNIKWKIQNPILSSKDKNGFSFNDVKKKLNFRK